MVAAARSAAGEETGALRFICQDCADEIGLPGGGTMNGPEKADSCGSEKGVGQAMMNERESTHGVCITRQVSLDKFRR